MYELLFKKILFPLYETHLRGRKTLQYYKELEESQWLSPEEIQQRQWESVIQLMKHCYENVSYYQNQFKRVGLTPEDIKDYGDFARLPVISKEEIRAHQEEMIATNYRNRVIFKSTGGSTGVPLQLAHDRNSYEWRIAVFLRGYGWAGCEDGKKTVYIWGAPIGEVPLKQKIKTACHQALLRRSVFNSFEFDEKRIEDCIKAINRIKPQGIVGYTTPVYNLAKFIKETNKKIINVPSIVTAAEKVEDYQRKLIEEVFAGKVFNTYGSREFMLIASECEYHQGLHVNSENLFVEILKNGKSAAPGESGELVITDLHNYGMPFVRYKNGDLAVASDRRCPCQRGLPLVEDIQGRLLDALQTTDGKIVPGEFFPHLMKEFKSVKKFQVIQESKEHLTLTIVLESPLTEDRLAFLKSEIQKVFGTSIRIDLNFVDDIPQTPSGKHRVTISKVPVHFGN